MTKLNLISDESYQLRVIARNLKNLLEARNLSESNVAQALNIPLMTVRRIITGETTDPRISTLRLFADYFDVSIDSLLESPVQGFPNVMKKQKPLFIPILDWHTASVISSISELDLSSLKSWHPIVVNEDLSISSDTFALESRPSMQPRFPLGTLFIIDPFAKPSDGDIVLIKMKSDGELSLRELVIDPPKWQLLPVVAGSESLFYTQTKHAIVGIIVLSIISRKEN